MGHLFKFYQGFSTLCAPCRSQGGLPGLSAAVQGPVPRRRQRQPAGHVNDRVLLGEHGGHADQPRPAEGQHFQPGPPLGQFALGKGQGHAARTLAVDGGADVVGGVRLPDQLHDVHGEVVPAHLLRGGAQIHPVGQDHVQDQAEGHPREHHQAELVVGPGIEPPQQPRHSRQQEKPAAVREDEPLVEGDQVVDRAVDDVGGVGDGPVQRKEPDQIDHPVELEPQMGPAPQDLDHSLLLLFYRFFSVLLPFRPAGGSSRRALLLYHILRPCANAASTVK